MNDQQTRYWHVDAGQSMEALLACDAIQEAAVLLRDGKTVAFPTETVYGLGADARKDAAVAEIFTAKGRPSDNPLIVHIANYEQLYALVEKESLSETVMQLANTFWPGPLTLVLPLRQGTVSHQVTAGLSTIAVRMPQHPIALALITAAQMPLAAPSANRSGRPSPTCAAHVADDLHGRIGGIVDGGASNVGLESTVVEVQNDRVIVLRPGGVSLEELRTVVKEAQMDPALAYDAVSPVVPRSPGVKYTHYAPQGTLVIVTGTDHTRIHERMHQELQEAQRRGLSTGVLTFDEYADAFAFADYVASYGSCHDPEQAAQRLYAALRSCDAANIQWIVAEGLPDDGLGAAVMNRLRKASGGRVIQV